MIQLNSIPFFISWC